MKYFTFLLLLFLGLTLAVRGGESSSSESDECLEECTREAIPVCGVEGTEERTFGNRCELVATNNCQKRNYVFKHIGTCDRPWGKQ